MNGAPAYLMRATARLSAGDRKGTGYLVAPHRIATCARLVQDVTKVSAAIGGRSLSTTVLAVDNGSDVAILGFEGDLDVEPLPLADEVPDQAEFLGFGFADEGGHPGRGFDGVVLKASTPDELVQVFSRSILTGETQARRGFLGSPLVVDGAVIAHLTKELGEDRDSRGYGVAYAAPARAICDLLDVKPEIQSISTSAAPRAERRVEELEKGHYHVFISYRSTDRDFAASLRERLEGAGLKVFLDQTELGPGDPWADSLWQAIANSRSAVVLASKDWLESKSCLQEASALAQRSAENKNFTLVTLRLDDTELPLFLSTGLRMDFRGQKRAEGPSIEPLIRSLLAGTAPQAATPPPAVAAEASVLDAFLRRLRAAETVGFKAVLGVVADWERYGAEDKTPLLRASELLIGLNRPLDALEVLERAGNGIRAVQLHALALDKSGRRDKAILTLCPLYDADRANAETGGILAGIYKRRWRDTGDESSLRRAHQVYLETWKRSGDPYNGINAAALALQLGDKPGSRKIALEVLQSLHREDESAFDHWKLATAGEAHLLNEDLAAARSWYAKAVHNQPDRIQDIAVMRAQARSSLKALGREEAALDDVFPLPTVIAFTGHMLDAPGRRAPRFPPAREGDVLVAIRSRLAKFGKVYAFCGAARGSDLLFLEALLERGGDARVRLPFRIEDYKETSVGNDWSRRFDAILQNDHVELIAPKESAPKALSDLQAAFGEANRTMYSEASRLAKGLDQEPMMMAVWDRMDQGDGPGGTADAVKFWKAQGSEHRVDVIDVHDPLGKGTRRRAGYPWRFALRLAAAAGVVAAAAIALVRETNLILDTRQVTSAEEISDEVRKSQSFSTSASAGLFVGVRKFSREHISEVPFAVDDAVDLAYLFSMELRLIDPKNVVLALSGEPQKWVSKKRLRELLSSGAVRREATFTEVIAEFSRMSARTKRDGIFVASIATHGFSDQGRDYLIASDSVRERVVTTGIPVSIVFDDMSRAKAVRRLLLLDACRELVSKDTRSLGQAVMSEELADAIGKASGLAVLSGSTKGGFSYDDPRERNGVFTNAIIEGLGGMASAVDGFITVNTLANYAQERVATWVEENHPEHMDVSKGISRGIEGAAASMPLALARPQK